RAEGGGGLAGSDGRAPVARARRGPRRLLPRGPVGRDPRGAGRDARRLRPNARPAASARLPRLEPASGLPTFRLIARASLRRPTSIREGSRPTTVGDCPTVASPCL